MNIIDIIEKKRNNIVLSYEELYFAFHNYLYDDIEDYQMSALLMTIMFNGLTNKEIIDLTDIFIESGKTIEFSKYGISADKHSTGGVGDKVTLIIGPIISAIGIKFPKMSGRGLGYTGGTIDKLESIPGIKLDLTTSELKKSIKKVGMAIVCQSEEFVPMDKAIYALRSATSCVSSIPLIAISIMSKKIAYGADMIYIDVKCGKGALVHTMDEAIQLSKTMEMIAKHYHKKIITEISNMDNPLGDNVGNALEVKEAIDILNGKNNNLAKLCKKISIDMVSKTLNIPKKEAQKKVFEVIDSKKALQKFYEFVANQNGKIDKMKISNKIDIINSPKSGTIMAIDALLIAKLSFSLGAGRLTKNAKIDYGVGVELIKNVGAHVKKGEPIMKIYYNKNRNYGNINNLFTIE